MKTMIIGAAVVVAIVGGIGAYMLVTKSSSDGILGSNSVSTTAGVDSPLVPVSACDVLTESVVKEVVGKNVKKVSQPINGAGLPGSTDNNITTCSYMSAAVSTTDTSTTPKINGATLMVYSAKTAAGAASNQSQFTTASSDIQKVENIGDIAFYNKTFRQLNILKGNNWYIVTNYKDTILNTNLEQDLALAKKLNLR